MQWIYQTSEMRCNTSSSCTILVRQEEPKRIGSDALTGATQGRLNHSWKLQCGEIGGHSIFYRLRDWDGDNNGCRIWRWVGSAGDAPAEFYSVIKAFKYSTVKTFWQSGRNVFILANCLVNSRVKSSYSSMHSCAKIFWQSNRNVFIMVRKLSLSRTSCIVLLMENDQWYSKIIKSSLFWHDSCFLSLVAPFTLTHHVVSLPESGLWLVLFNSPSASWPEAVTFILIIICGQTVLPSH